MAISTTNLLVTVSCIVLLYIGYLYISTQIPYGNQINDSFQGPGTGRSWSWSSFGNLDNSTPAQSNKKCFLPLKVFMYDLPRKYNLGMLTKHDVLDKNQNTPWPDPIAPPWSHHGGIAEQHSVEYWLMVYLLDRWDRKDGKMAAVRVKDPEQADVFFVPFFGSSSFSMYGRNMKSPEAQVDFALQEGVINYLETQSPMWKASKGHDHVFIVHHPNAFRHFRALLNSSILIVADFGRYTRNIARLEKDIVAPYTHVLPTYEDDNAIDPFSARRVLLYFQGRISRKDDGIVRTKLKNLLTNISDVHYTNNEQLTIESVAEATAGMRSSRFCLHPAGDTPSSCRLFDAIVSHCVPVIVSDKIELPFEDDLNYDEFSLFFSSEEAVKPDYLVTTLRSVKKEEWLRMWTRLKAISHHFEYQYPAKKDDAADMIFKQVQRKVPAMRLQAHRRERLKIPDEWSMISSNQENINVTWKVENRTSSN